MFSLRPFAAAVLVSLGLGALFFLWAWFQPSGGDAWVTVYLNTTASDRKIVENLNKEGITAVGESSVWVLLDTFSAVEQIPLDRWEEAVEPYDPRNDGYAEQLRSSFVREGERRFFVERKGFQAEKLKNILRETVGSGEGVLWRAEFPSPHLEPFVMLFFAAASAVCAVWGGLSSLFAFLCILPVLVFLCLAGPEGLVPAGILEAVFFLLREPLAERFRSARGASRIIHHSLADELSGWFRTFPRELLGSLAGLVLYAVFAYWGNIPLVISFPVLCFLVPVLLLPPWAESRSLRNVFFPLPIRKGQLLLLFPPPLPVFTLAFVIALGFSAAGGDMFSFEIKKPAAGAVVSNKTWSPLPDEAAYERHASFQRSFSGRSLHEASGYVRREDSPSHGNTPPYPYPETLRRSTENYPAPSLSNRTALSPARYASLLGLMVLLSIPALVRIIKRPHRDAVS